MKKSISVLAAVFMVSWVMVVLGAPPAVAATKAPACVDRHVYNSDGMPQRAMVRLTNNCRTTKKVKVIWTRAHDSRCFTLRSGERIRAGSSIAVPFSSYNKTVLC